MMNSQATTESTSDILILTPETDMRLRAVTARAGEPVGAFADALLTEALADYEDTLTGIERGLAAAGAGDEQDFETFVAQRRAKRRQQTAAA